MLERTSNRNIDTAFALCLPNRLWPAASTSVCAVRIVFPLALIYLSSNLVCLPVAHADETGFQLR